MLRAALESGVANYGAPKIQSLTQKQEKQLVKETELEFKRRGKFKRVFPSLDYQYYR